MDDKTKSIVAHLTIIGWIIALVMNQNDKGPLTSFYLRQTLGIYILYLTSWLPIPFVAYIVWILVFILWLLSLINALSGTEKTVPFLGDQFQQWFRGIA